MNYSFIPVVLNGEKVGSAQIENGNLLLKIEHRLIRGMTWGYDIDHISITYAEQEPHDAVITIHSIKEKGN